MSESPNPRYLDLNASINYCCRLARRTGRNFYYSFLTLPPDQRRDMCVLYAFMRVCDDIGDDGNATTQRRQIAIEKWRTQTRQAIAGELVDHPVLPALGELVRRRQLPQRRLEDVITGVERDLHPTTYETFEDLADYCYHVAGAVGICCIHVWGFQGEEAIDRAIDCGLAFQLTNILRDLAEDAAMGRIYLPTQDLVQFAYTADDLRTGTTDARFHALMDFEIGRARDYYSRSSPLFGHLEPGGRSVLCAMREIYGSLLNRIDRERGQLFQRRISVPRWRKLAIVARAIVRPR